MDTEEKYEVKIKNTSLPEGLRRSEPRGLVLTAISSPSRTRFLPSRRSDAKFF